MSRQRIGTALSEPVFAAVQEAEGDHYRFSVDNDTADDHTSDDRTPAPTTLPGPKTEFTSGTFRVGVDIASGTYVAPGGSGCYWERESVFGGGGSDSIIANDFFPGQGQVVVTIAASDKGFKTSGCGTWKRG